MNIYHPYGTVGALPLQKYKNGSVIAKYGAEPDANKLYELAGGIITFTEATDIESDTEKIRSAVGSVKMMIFLGFGSPSQHEIDCSKKTITQVRIGAINLLRDKKCYELFDECWHLGADY